MVANDVLLKLGCKPNSMGYRYLVELIDMSLEGVNILPLTNVGYKLLGEKYDKKIGCIEKNIQNCINAAWINGDSDLLYSYFGETISESKGKPTNKHFICAIVDKVRNNGNNS